MKKTKALFLDRDGIIVKKIRNEAPQTPYQLHLITEIIPIIQKAKECGYLTIMVSNQPDIALGIIDENTRKNLEGIFKKLLKDSHIVLDAMYYCYHDKNGVVVKYKKDCNCRKPKPGMLLKAIKKFNINVDESFMLGDRASDVKAGNLAGVKTILFDPQKSQVEYLLETQIIPDYQIKVLEEVIKIICKP